jgi:hypothetical protein
MEGHTLLISLVYRGSSLECETYLCKECTIKFEDWLACKNIEDRLEKVADRLEKMVGDDHVCKG